MEGSSGAFQVQNGRAARRGQVLGESGMSFSDVILTIITAGGGGAVVTFFAFRFLATSWLESKFEERLEAYRHENAKELQSLRANVDGALSRTVKSQEKEFEVLTESWRLAGVAHGTTGEFVSRYKTYADVNKMTDDALAEYLDQYDFEKSEVAEIFGSEDRTIAFIERIFWLRRNVANKSIIQFQNYIFLNQVFIEEPIYKDMQDLSSELFEVHRDYQIAYSEEDYKSSNDAHRKFKDELTPKLTALAPVIRSKFFDRI